MPMKNDIFFITSIEVSCLLPTPTHMAGKKYLLFVVVGSIASFSLARKPNFCSTRNRELCKIPQSEWKLKKEKSVDKFRAVTVHRERKTDAFLVGVVVGVVRKSSLRRWRSLRSLDTSSVAQKTSRDSFF